MCLKQVFISALLTVCLSSCAFQPTIVPTKTYCERDMFTNKLTLELREMEDLSMCEGKDLGACVVAVGLIAPVSFIVSGSVVLLGNTLYWSEYIFRC